MTKKTKKQAGRKASTSGTKSRPTASDLLARVATASGTRERRRLRAQAEALADDGPTWCAIAAAYAADGDREGALRAVDRALALGKGEIWVHRNAAKVLLSLGDREAAAQALAAAASQFDSGEVPVYNWQLLAAGYRELLEDEAAALDCLARGLARATTSDDLCSLAAGHAQGGDLATARALLARARGLIEQGSGAFPWWTLANAWHGPLGDAAEAHRVLLAGRDAATSTDDAVIIARAFHGFDPGSDDVRACLALAEEKAVSAGDWVTAAEGFHSLLREETPIRRCLSRALFVASVDDADARRKIADGLRRWLGEGNEAESVAPSGLRPAQILGEAGGLISGYNPDTDSLLNHLRGLVDLAALQRIAGADYGSDAEEHLAALTEIRDRGLVPHPLDWHPHEVLALVRWGEGESVDHRERAFVCAVLSIDDAGPRCLQDGGPESTLPVLLESCEILGPAALDGLIGLTAAMAGAFASREELGSEAFARLALLLAAAARDPGDARLPEGVDALIALERRCHEEEGSYSQPEQGWLFGLTFFDLRAPLWRDLIVRHAARSPAIGRLAALI
jgi:tetratricopeptide (TPR) repeat protein